MGKVLGMQTCKGKWVYVSKSKCKKEKGMSGYFGGWKRIVYTAGTETKIGGHRSRDNSVIRTVDGWPFQH